MNQKKKNILLGVLIIGVISMSVAFAALSTNLSISGSASIPTTSWNIHFANNHDSTQSPHQDGTVNRGTITGVQFAATSITGFTATLYQPNDEVVYEFDIVNEGTIDAQLDSFTKTLTCNTSNCSMITYTIDCEDAQQNDANQSDYILAHGQSVSCVMKIKYNEQTNSGNGVYEQGAVNATATASWLYKQVESNGGNSGGQGGNEEPTSWNNYITPSQTSGGATLPQGSTMWIQENTQSGDKQLCGVFTSGTECIVADSDGRYDEFDCNGQEQCSLSGYTLQKKNEFESENFTCIVFNTQGTALSCRNNEIDLALYIEGLVSMFSNNHGCYIGSDGTSVCQ